ncbi:MAG TPA: ABC transporter ATP-binding protein [Acidimicrobiales bacterium]|nr:ABC transporter ATP-binding protein [Acidimicrobiales bacterium]
MDVIEVNDLRRAYGRTRALDGVDLAVQAGTTVAVLGPNGAGKSTLIEILEGHRSRDGGTVRVLGRDPERGTRAWRDRLGIVLQESRLVSELTARELLDLYAGYYAAPRPVPEVLAETGLVGRADRRPEQMSGGERRRLELALAIVGRPELLFLDEPTASFDPEARRRTWELVAGLQDAGITVVLTTHDLEEAAALADRIVVLAEGRVVADASPPALRAAAGPPVVRFRVPVGVAPPPLRVALDRHADGTLSAAVPQPTDLLRTLCTWEEESGHRLSELSVTCPTLEDAYFELIR